MMVRAFYDWDKRGGCATVTARGEFGIGLYDDAPGGGAADEGTLILTPGVGWSLRVFGDAIRRTDGTWILDVLAELCALQPMDAESLTQTLLAAGWQDWTHRGDVVPAPAQ